MLKYENTFLVLKPGISSGPHALLVFIASSNALIREGLKSMSNSLSVLKHMSVLYMEGSENWSKKNLLNMSAFVLVLQLTMLPLVNTSGILFDFDVRLT